MGLIRMGPPDELIKRLSSEFAIRNFVETGTYEGATACWASEHFENVFTIEMSEHFYEETRKKYDRRENINFIFGDSRVELRKIVGKLNESAIFWLDAHWSGGATYGDDDQCPIIKEIEIINDSPRDNFIFIDDARLFASPPQPPHLPEQWADIVSVLKALQGVDNDKYIVIIEDVIIAVPAFAKTMVAHYCQNVNARLWEEYGRQIKQQNKSNFRKGAELIYADLPATLKKRLGIARKVLIK